MLPDRGRRRAQRNGGNENTKGQRMETLTLSTGVAEIWTIFTERIAPELRTEDKDAEDFVLTGGAVLSARWGHRREWNIDVLTQDERGTVEAIHLEANGGPRSLAAETGAVIPCKTEPLYNVLKYRTGRIRIRRRCEAGPGNRNAQPALVNGRRMLVADTQYILREAAAKEMMDAVDVYDALTAARLDRDAYRKVWLANSREARTDKARLWRMQNVWLTRRARDLLRTPDGERVRDADNLGRQAAEMLEAQQEEGR